MSALTKFAICLSAVGLVSACGESTIEPMPSQAVASLATSGGFAGVDFEFAVDGPTGVVHGVRCVSFCDWEDGDVLATATPERVAELESTFDAVDFLAGEDEDFGTECCDQFHYQLNLTRSDASRTITGSSEKLPPNILALIRDVEEWVATERDGAD